MNSRRTLVSRKPDLPLHSEQTLLLLSITLCQDIHQTPKDLIKDPGQSEVLRCSHSSSYNVMLWYKQKRGESLELLGYLVDSGDTVEDTFKNKISLDGDAYKNSVLKLESLSSDDSAVYFCAASTHSAVASLPSQQKHWCISSPDCTSPPVREIHGLNTFTAKYQGQL
uniref:Ig-like domain-containing protein n=1 Tax=Sinocyclocheilus rhinocerous TaxID=307959 RepID=A0A673HH79_9TELE